MSRLVWDDIGKRYFETGVEQGVLYPRNSISGLYPLGVPWNGLTGVTESPSGAEANPIYANNIKYLNLLSAEEFAATIEAFTYPDEFSACNGEAEVSTGITVGQQDRQMFGLCYKTILGNDVLLNSYGYKLHIIYGCVCAPSEKGYATINDSPEAITFSWEISTTPVNVTGFKPTASMTINSTKVDATKLAALEDILYGTAGTDPRLPLPDEIVELFGSAAPEALALSTIVPADDTANVAIDANIVITFNNKIHSEAIIVTDDAGSIVAGSKSWDAAGKVLTFNPTANLTNNTTYLVTIGGVVDIYNQTLASVVKNFTTVA